MAAIVAVSEDPESPSVHQVNLLNAAGRRGRLGLHALAGLGMVAERQELAGDVVRLLENLVRGQLLVERVFSAVALAHQGNHETAIIDVLAEAENRFQELSALKSSFSCSLTGLVNRAISRI